MCVEHRKHHGQTMSMNSVRQSFNLEKLEKVKRARYTEQPKNEESVDENGIRTIIEYALNDDGKKVKVRHVQVSP